MDHHATPHQFRRQGPQAQIRLLVNPRKDPLGNLSA